MDKRAGEWIGDVYQEYFVEPGSSDLVIKRTQDVEPLLDQNKRDANSGKNRKGHLREVANIPTIAVLMFKQKHGLDVFNTEHRIAILKLIRTDPDYKYMRTV